MGRIRSEMALKESYYIRVVVTLAVVRHSRVGACDMTNCCAIRHIYRLPGTAHSPETV